MLYAKTFENMFYNILARLCTLVEAGGYINVNEMQNNICKICFLMFLYVTTPLV